MNYPNGLQQLNNMLFNTLPIANNKVLHMTDSERSEKSGSELDRYVSARVFPNKGTEVIKINSSVPFNLKRKFDQPCLTDL